MTFYNNQTINFLVELKKEEIRVPVRVGTSRKMKIIKVVSRRDSRIIHSILNTLKRF